ncbi:MAG: D-alanyl-D-alanine carboxypeptidase [Thermoleophilaceae bacterium]|jgi:D-alanyl-D-alanine carboxypeptidase|nr:D-alanyl-D-alanine carboxypeptidase [Thermoleophilaceae bacterium]
MVRVRHVAWVPTVVVGLSLATAGVAAADLRTDLDSALQQGRETTGAPAATGAVVRCGQLLWSGANGVLDVNSGRPATTRTRIAIASSTKPVTATLIMGLVQRKKLSLTTKLSRFYPHLPKAKKISVRMLLNHTSGLNDYFDSAHINDLIAKHPSHRWKRSEVIKAITRTLFKPGTKHSYSNSNYVVLGGIVEKLTHGTVEHAFRTRIVGPLQLTDSTFAYHPEQSDLFAHPYVKTSSGLQDQFAPGVGLPSDFWGPVWTDGGLASTAQDLARFGDGLFEAKLLSAKTVKTMTKIDRFGGGLGVFPLQYAGHRWLGHNGRYAGYESEVWYDAQRRVTITVTSNASQSSLATWAQLVAAYDGNAPSTPQCPAPK